MEFSEYHIPNGYGCCMDLYKDLMVLRAGFFDLFQLKNIRRALPCGYDRFNVRSSWGRT